MFTRVFLISLLLVLTNFSFGQRVNNVRAEQNGSVIDIYYSIENSSTDQYFQVTIECDTGKGNKIELQAVSGDVGKNIQGGKNEYKASWDVLEDVEELRSADFIVSIELQSYQRSKTSSTMKPWLVGYNLSTGYAPFGFRLGYGKTWGGYISGRFGSDGFEQLGNVITDRSIYAINLGVMRSVYEKDNFSVQAYVGAGIAQWGNYEFTETQIELPDSSNGFQGSTTSLTAAGNADKGMEVEYGLILNYNNIYLSSGAVHNLGDIANHIDLVLGVGLRF